MKPLRKDNDWGFDWLPRVTGDHSHFGYWLDMADGKLDGLFVMGQNPAVGASNGRLERKALSKLKWLVVRDMVETETASFWYASPEVERGELSPETIGTEVFLFPAAGTAEKEGTFTNTQRLLQYREKAVDPPGDARSETWFMYHLGRRLKRKAQDDPRPRNDGLASAYLELLHRRASTPNRVPKKFCKEINGYPVADRKQLKHIKDLKNDGSTACGAWIYCGVFPEEDRNRATERNPKDLLGHGWGFAWPNDCRIIYNRASARPDGQPWSERKKLVWWDAEKKEWTGLDNAGLREDTPPDTPANMQKGQGTEALGGARPFTLHPDGVGWLYVPSGLKDGPLPDALRTPGVARGKSAVRAANESCGGSQEAPRQSLRCTARCAVPLRSHHLSAYGAPHGGWHDAGIFRTSANCSRNCSPKFLRNWQPRSGWNTATGPLS